MSRRTYRIPPLAELERECAEFNSKYPVGTPVTYQPLLNQPDIVQTTTRSEAWIVGSHTVCVLVTGVCGAVATRHVSPEIL